MAAPTEGKVWAASAGAGAGLTVATFLCWVAGVVFWDASADATKAADAVGAVPAPVSAMLILGLTYGAAFYAGWRAKHTSRAVEPVPVDDVPVDDVPVDPVVDAQADPAPPAPAVPPVD